MNKKKNNTASLCVLLWESACVYAYVNRLHVVCDLQRDAVQPNVYVYLFFPL